VLAVAHGDDSVQGELRRDFVVDEKGLRDGGWVSQTRRLDDDRIELRDLPPQLLEGDHQVATDSAADAAVHHLDDLLVRLLGENALVDAHLAELILDDGESQSVMWILEDVVEQGGLARSEETRQDRHRHLLLGHLLSSSRRRSTPSLPRAGAVAAHAKLLRRAACRSWCGSRAASPVAAVPQQHPLSCTRATRCTGSRRAEWAAHFRVAIREPDRSRKPPRSEMLLPSGATVYSQPLRPATQCVQVCLPRGRRRGALFRVAGPPTMPGRARERAAARALLLSILKCV
jgi:hypothetical protein